MALDEQMFALSTPIKTKLMGQASAPAKELE